MFIGNFVIGKPEAKQQANLVLNKDVKKLQVLCRQYRLDNEVEAILVMNPEGLETVLKEYLERYQTLQGNNSQLFLQNLEKYRGLFPLFGKYLPDSLANTLLLLRLADTYPEVHEEFCKRFSSYSATVQNEFVNLVRKEPYKVKLSFVLHFPDSPLQFANNEYGANMFRDFIRQGNRDLFRRYIRRHGPLAEFLQNTFLNICTWEYFSDYIEITQELFKKGRCLGYSSFFEFTQGAIYVRFKQRYPDENNYHFTLEAEAGLFEQGFEKLLLQTAKNDQLVYRANKLKFLCLLDRFSEDVVRYFHTHEAELAISADEQLELMQHCIRLSLCFSQISLKAEALLLSADYRSYLFNYVNQRQLRHHENEFQFLMMYQHYPQEIEGYLHKYGKSLTLTSEERARFEQICPRSWLIHFKSSGLKELKIQVLPELRRKHIAFTSEHLPMLIHLSLDNPLLLRKYLEKHGRIEDKYEPELFFCADKKLRDDYVRKHSINYHELIRYAPHFGATAAEHKLLTQSWDNISGYVTRCIKDYNPRTPLSKLQKLTIFDVEIDCDFCHWYYKTTACLSRRQMCHDMWYDTRHNILNMIQKSATNIEKCLYNIANRNYLTARL